MAATGRATETLSAAASPRRPCAPPIPAALLAEAPAFDARPAFFEAVFLPLLLAPTRCP